MGGTANNRTEERFRHDNGCFNSGGVKLQPYYVLQNCNMTIFWQDAVSPRKEKECNKHMQCS